MSVNDSLIAGPATTPGGRPQRMTPALVALILAGAVSACFFYVPWDLLAAAGFPDRDNYLESIGSLVRSGAGFLDFGNADYVALLLNEYLWREILVFIGGNFPDPSIGLLMVSAMAAALSAYHIVRRAGVLYGLVFLLSPVVLDLYISQIRSALALGIFLSALGMRRLVPKYLLFVTAFLIHSFAAVLFIAYHFSTWVLESKGISTRTRLSMTLLFALVASAVWAFLAAYIFDAIGDRRASQQAILPASIPFAMWWMMLTTMLVAFARVETRAGNGPYVMIGVFLQSLFIFSTLLGAGSLRFLSMSLPFVFIAIRSMGTPVLRVCGLSGTIVFNVILFSYWLS